MTDLGWPYSVIFYFLYNIYIFVRQLVVATYKYGEKATKHDTVLLHALMQY